MTVNGLAEEIDWRETDVGLVARLGLKIIRSEVVADGVAERPGPWTQPWCGIGAR